MMKNAALFFLFSLAVLLALAACTKRAARNGLIAPPSSSILNVRRAEYIAAKKIRSFSDPAPERLPSGQENTQGKSFRTDPRLALVIGNAGYRHWESLDNPENDARAIGAALRKLQFQVSVYTGLGITEMHYRIQAFREKLKRRKYSACLFFYAGHGIQDKGENFLLPVDAPLHLHGNWKKQAVSVSSLISWMREGGSNVNLVILDACRNSPFGKQRGVSQKLLPVRHAMGLAQMKAPSDFFIAYSTSPGEMASDGVPGKNSPYTAALLEHIGIRGSIENMFKKVRKTTMEKTGGTQVSWENTSLTVDFSFHQRGGHRK